MRTTILYEDKHIIVAGKPAGLAVQTAKVGQVDMVSELKNYIHNSYLGIVHRLDQPVEGILVFGRTKPATSGLSRQLADKTLHKKYYAVVLGSPTETEGELVDYLRKTADNRAEVVECQCRTTGKPAETRCRTTGKPAETATENGSKAVLRYHIRESRGLREALAGENPNESQEKSLHSYSAKIPEDSQKKIPEKCTEKRQINDMDVSISLVDIQIETGRFHQIRAQMAHAGMPLLGDVKYGSPLSMEISRELGVRNVALCAYELELEHPVSGKSMRFCVSPQAEIFKKFCFELPK